LKDLSRPEHIFQLTIPGLPADFPPLRALDVTAHNLPVQLTSFVGRESELQEARRLLAATRLLTLTGPGGTGKTRLSLQVAAEVLDQFPDGAWLVELAPLADPVLVPAALAAVWNVHEQPGRPLTEALVDYLRARSLLLILDNCEHVIDACARLVTRLLNACPRLKVLPSSREALGVAGETAYRVPSLAVPDDQCASPQSLLRFDAARLFVERAQAAQPRFAPTADNLRVIIQICQRLDGIPLAIELAAARTRMLSVAQIAARLDDRFRLLTGGSRTALPRQQTLRALIDWSYDLLPEPEQAALRQLSVFAGGWTLEAAEAVLGKDEDPFGRLKDEVEPPDSLHPLELLSQLVNKSLVVVDVDDSGAAGEARYRLLETIRQYGREKLVAAPRGEGEAARRRHLGYCLTLVAHIEPLLYGPEMVACLDRLEVEEDNLRAALDWSLENDPRAALQLVVRLEAYWMRRRHGEGLKLVKSALARAEAAATSAEGPARIADDQARARALVIQASLEMSLGDNRAARATIDLGLALARQVGPPQTLAFALGMGAVINGFLGEVVAGRAKVDEFVALAKRAGFAFQRALFSGAYIFLALAANETPPAAAMDEALEAARATGNPFVMGMVAQNTARVAVMTGQLDQALAGYEEAARLFAQVRDRSLYNGCRSEMAHVLRQQGRLNEALALYRETIPVWQELGHRAAVAHEVESLAFMAQAHEEFERTARLLGAAEAERERLSLPMTPVEHREYAANLAALRVQGPSPELDTAWAAGRALTMDQAVAYALDQGVAPGTSTLITSP
jgi:predicted ATPase